LDDRANGRATREVIDEGLDDDEEFWSKPDNRGINGTMLGPLDVQVLKYDFRTSCHKG